MNYYDKISAGYNELHREEQQRKMELILSELEVKETDYLLDVGCGSGFSLEPFNCKKIGIDPSEELVSKIEGDTIVGFAEDLPFDSNTFDIVISVSAIHNFEDPEKAIKEMLRVGKDIFVITVFKKGNKKKVEKIQELIKNNFNVVKKIEDIHDNIFICKSLNSK